MRPLSNRRGRPAARPSQPRITRRISAKRSCSRSFAEPARRESAACARGVRLAFGIDLVRPLLRVSPESLRDYCHFHGLPYAVDPTNADFGVRRNAVREALGALRPLFPGLDEAVARAAELVGDERESSARSDLRRRVRERLARETPLRDVDFTHVEAAVRTLESGGSGTFFMKPGVRLEILRGDIAGISRE